METVKENTNNGTVTDGIAADVTTAESSLHLPSWINSDYFREILVLDGKSTWKYISHEVRMANEKGENYAAVLYRVKVIAENEGKLCSYVGEKFNSQQSVPQICYTIIRQNSVIRHCK